MEELTPIRQIEANFGKPIRLTCPNAEDFVRRLMDEVEEVEDNSYNAFIADSFLWESTISKEQLATFHELTKKRNTAEKAYDPKVHRDSSPEAQAFFKADDELNRYVDSCGQHLCFRCSYYETTLLDSGRIAAGCTRKKNNSIAVRPYTLACKHYTTGVTSHTIEAEKEYAEACRQNPGFASYVRKRQRENYAKRFADYLKDSPSTAFFIYEGSPEYHEKIYNDFPLILAETQYPSFPLFLEAYKRWQQDVIITRRKGFNGAEEVKMSISKPEFKPKDMVVPPSDTKTSNN